MDRTVPWDYLAGEIGKHYPQMGKVGRQPYPIETMLRIHFKQQWFVATRPSKLAQMRRGMAKAQTEIEYMKASLQAKVEHPFRVIKRQFGYTKVRNRGLAKNTAN